MKKYLLLLILTGCTSVDMRPRVELNINCELSRNTCTIRVPHDASVLVTQNDMVIEYDARN